MKKVLLGLGLVSSVTIGMPKSYDITATYNYAKISGFVQIPRGGKNGTTSVERPTLRELGIKDSYYPEFTFGANWQDFSIYTNINYQKFKGSTTLKNDLITHAYFVPSGSHISSHHSYVSYSLGGKYNLYKKDNFSVRPLMEFSLYQFEYKYDIKTPNSQIKDKRRFGWGQLNLGVESVYTYGKNTVSLSAKMGIPYDSVKTFYNINLTESYNVYKNIDIVASVGYEKLKYRDTQKEKQNFMNHKLSPIVKLGLSAKF